MTVTINAASYTTSYGEIPQQLNIRFAWAAKKAENEFQMQHPLVKCRDFLPDFFWMLDNKAKKRPGKETIVYGYATMDHHVFSPYMALELNTGSIDNLENNMKAFIPEDAIKFIGSNDKFAIVRWSIEALDAPWKISFFTFMLKLCCAKKADSIEEMVDHGTIYSNEASYILSVGADRIKAILKNWNKLEDPSQKIGSDALQSRGLYDVHNNTGFVAQFKARASTVLNDQLRAFL